MADRIARDSWKKPSPHALKEAPVETIDREISRAYQHAKAASEKPPNIHELVARVRASLAVLGYFASRRQIQEAARNERPLAASVRGGLHS
jgi:hypothetical protein